MPRFQRGGLAVALTAVIAVGAIGCSTDTECGQFPLNDDDRRCVVETIDGMVHQSFPFADYKGVELDEFSDRLEQTLERETDDQEFLSDVNSVIGMLNDGHTRMERRYLEERAIAPVGVRQIDDDVVIDRVDVGVDDDDRAELIGERVEQIDDRDARRVVNEHQGWAAGVEGTEVMLSGTELALSGPAGSEVELTLEGGETVRLQRRRLHERPQVQRYGDVGYIRIDTFGFIDDLERIDEAINEVSDTEGLMIDLRGNGGGFPSVSEGLFSRLIDQEQGAFRMVDVDGNLHRKLPMEPRGDSYDGEVTLLVNNSTYSASNLVAHRFSYHDRGPLVGEPTGGGAASPANGAMLLPGIWFQVSTNVVRDPEGNHTESGIDPDLEVNVDEEVGGIIEGSEESETTGDPVMDRALMYLNGEEQ